MVIDPEVGLIGTIGGGCGEADVLAAAREVIGSGAPRLVRVELTDPVDSWSPAVCGGVMEVFVEAVKERGESFHAAATEDRRRVVIERATNMDSTSSDVGAA
jgi:xanthine/CO dehydrogenase XdhC/CoxF family maturation factor